MCGILGVAVSSGVERWEARVETALDAVEHRGPDARATKTIESIGSACVLGHTRLRIVDLSPAADQPMSNEDGSAWVTYNGELYNGPELRRQLEHEEHVFRSRTDTELLVHLYEQVNGDVRTMLHRLRGMFAFALFDTQRGRLVLARDRLGIKPMYFAPASGGVAFASEVRALARLGVVDGDPDEHGLGAYLVWGRLPRERTLIRGIRSLPPGSYLEWDESGTKTTRWFEPRADPDPDLAADGTRLLRAALDDAVARHLVADRPVGVFLSGGVDSGTVVRLAARSGSVRALTVTFPDARDDEGASAGKVARAFGADHTEIPITGEDLIDALPRIISAMDQPTADGVNTWLVCKAARDSGLVVALSGLGGDELFGGYPSFDLVPRIARARGFTRIVPGVWRKAIARAASRRSPGSRIARAILAEPGYEGAYGAVRQLFAPEELRAFDVRVSLPHADVAGTAASNAADRVMLLEATNYLPHQLLRDTDQMSMAHSLEVRVPLLDDSVVRVALALPASVRNAQGKRMLATAAGGPVIPKRPFELPMDRWMRGPLSSAVREALLSQDLPFAREIPTPFRRHLWRRFLEGRTHWSRPWSIAVIRMWPAANGFQW